MASVPDAEVYDLLILVDATASMSSYLAALNHSLQQIISISALTNCFERIGLLAYRDYGDKDLLEWSGWMTTGAGAEDGQPDLVKLATSLRATGGGDYPEATKTGLARAYEVMRPEAKTLILLYSDAPPHASRGEDTGYPNAAAEQTALKKVGIYGGKGHLFADWVTAARILSEGDKKAQVMCILDDSFGLLKTGYYNYLAEWTNGACFCLNQSQPRQISELTVEVLLAWMGVKKDGAGAVALPAQLIEYTTGSDFRSLDSEQHPAARKFFITQTRAGDKVELVRTPLSTTVLEAKLPKKTTPLRNFAKTYQESGKYRGLVTTQLRELIERDIAAITLNPVFGSLWRTVCNDRENDGRQELLDLFGRKVDAIKNADEKSKMKQWLEESYDYTAEVLETIATVPESLRFPCVCLDPTMAFDQSNDAEVLKNDNNDDDENRPITAFRRDELLEIGRSCDWRILRRLGRILTRLTFIDTADTMPAHIAVTNDVDVPKIPLALANPQYGRRFWRILLHIVVPGTMLSGRGAALLAALSLRLGVKPLSQAAETEMQLWRDKWNDLEVPETWSINCLSLLMDADKSVHSQASKSEDGPLDRKRGLLIEQDRTLFERLVDYKLLELNLNTTLHAQVAWTPQKVSMPVGPLIICKSCKLPRSVTIMGPHSVCGLCCYQEAHPDDQYRENIAFGATKEDTEGTNTYWYECNVQSCMAQYIVYNVAGLNVRPKCHYCRNGSLAPVLQCTKCLSRMIWPEEYRSGAETADFLCMGCKNERQTEVSAETTANQLRDENGNDWLLKNKDMKLAQPFNNRTLYHTASNAKPLDDFAEKVHVLPCKDSTECTLHLRGKTIRNTPALIDELHSWVSRRRTESGTCSLCFSNVKKHSLLPACGRSGCHQRVCKGCLDGWYGLNAAGRIINTAALHCPFCRRAPTAKTLARNGMGVHALGSLKEAVEQRGEWIYAWCAGCGHAKQYMERVCAGGAPPELERWTCDECRAPKGGRTSTIRPCPGCGVETEKIGGCDHISCTQCGAHWCFFCGAKQEEEEIYDHMNREHGGYFAGGEEEDYDDFDDDDYT